MDKAQDYETDKYIEKLKNEIQIRLSHNYILATRIQTLELAMQEFVKKCENGLDDDFLSVASNDFEFMRDWTDVFMKDWSDKFKQLMTPKQSEG